VTSSPSPFLALKSDCIDLWFIEPSQLSSQHFDSLIELLTDEEQHKIQQYKHKATQDTALITRAFARLVLAKYSGQTTSTISFKRNNHGKPELEKNSHNIRFNLSHNNKLIVMAVCLNDDIGCDIEDPTRKINIEPISRRYFAKQEHQQLTALNNKSQQQRFFEIWTLKEAFVKATGIGIGLGLDSFYFELNDKNRRITNESIKIHFNEHYPLEKQQDWQCYQNTFAQQSLAISRASSLQQNIIFLNALDLLTEHD
jgi:4'-phosphopantetheinyl transferase